MADKKITALTEGTSLANGDIVPFVDVSDTTDAPSGTTKHITKANLVTDLYSALGSSLDADYQPLDSQLTSIAGLTPGAEGRIITSNGLGGYQISTPGDVRSYLNVENGADVTDATNVDAAGATMNSDTNVGSNGWVLQAADSDTEDDTKVGSWTKTRNYVDNVTSAIQNSESDESGTTVTNTTTETTVYSFSIPANALDTNGVCEFYVAISDFGISTSTSEQLTATLDVNTNQLTSATILQDTSTSRSGYKGYIRGSIIAASSTSAQEGSLEFFVGASGSPFSLGTFENVMALAVNHNSSSEDSTSAITVDVRLKWQSASGANTVTTAYAYNKIFKS